MSSWVLWFLAENTLRQTSVLSKGYQAIVICPFNAIETRINSGTMSLKAIEGLLLHESVASRNPGRPEQPMVMASYSHFTRLFNPNPHNPHLFTTMDQRMKLSTTDWHSNSTQILVPYLNTYRWPADQTSEVPFFTFGGSNLWSRVKRFARPVLFRFGRIKTRILLQRFVLPIFKQF